MDIFDRYREANDAVAPLPGGKIKEQLRSAVAQLLSIEQTRKVAEDQFHLYQRKMNDWENNILNQIKREAQKAAGDEDGRA